MVIKEGNKMPDSAKSLMGAGGVPVDRKHRLKHRFEVVKKLGQGTYGKVQLAVNKETGQEVAIKTIKKSKIESDQDLVRIRREIQIMSSVQHPHIIHIYEVFENKEKIVLVMQYASGGELYDYLSDKKVLTDVEARRVFRQIAAAIYYCHKNKICHRDLKLENVLLDERGNAKIADFGLSNVFDDRHLLSTYCGSPLYASPEIVKGTPYYGPEVDCWSMGVLLYTLVYGAMPFDGSNFKRLVKQISEGDYYEPKKKSEASGLIRHLLTVNPSKRATIIDICSDWWVNISFEHSLLQVAEDTANLTPVRIDLLLALAPVSPPPNKILEEPQFETPKLAVQPEEVVMTSSGHEDSEGASHDDGEVTSDSFAFVSGGMSTQMAPGGNPDDLFDSRYGSDEEFLSAEAAAALEGQTFKRERSFDVGSVMRVSSMAHKSKKPRKSDSSRSGIPLEARPEVLGGNSSSERKLSSETLVEEDGAPVVAEREPPKIVKDIIATEVCSKDEKPKEGAEILTVISSPEVVPECKPEADSPKQNQPSETSSTKVEPIPKTKTVEKIPIDNENKRQTEPLTTTTTDQKTLTDVKTEPPKEKKVKRKIVSKKQTEKKADDAVVPVPKSRETSPMKRRDRSLSVDKTKEKTPVKERTPEKPRHKSPVKSRQSSPEKPRAKSKSPEKPAVKSPPKQPEPAEKKEIKKSGTTPGRIIIRRRSELSPDNTESKPPVTSNNAVRKPGKLVMPRFLDSAQGQTPSPKVGAEPKKLVIPIRSVSDAKKAFETKKSEPAPTPGSRKSSLVPQGEIKEPSIEKKESTKQEPKITETISKQESDKIALLEATQDSLEKGAKSDLVGTKLPKKSDEATQKTEATQKPDDAEINLSSLESTTSNKESTSQVPDVTEEQKKAAAKSILKKSLAKARLAERKLSQQSSIDSDAGSQTSTPIVSMPATPQTEPKSHFKVPKPFSKEILDDPQNITEIKLITRNKPESKSSSAQEETIWGTPMSPTENTSSKLKRSVLSSSIESEMNNWRKEMEESLKRLSPEGASEENTPCHSQNSVDSEVESGPAPITRSYKKFTFTKDGSTITETGEVYTKPATDGTWTKVEKKTKVTTQAQPKGYGAVNIKPLGSPKPMPQAYEPRLFKESSPLRHSDSQSSSGSNDVFDDIFDSWTGDNMFNNILKMDSVFDRFAKGSLKRHDSRRSSLRRPKTSREKELKPGHSTDRESSDNDDDFDFHFDGKYPVSCGSHGLMNLMKSVNKDFNHRLQAFKERHGSFGRSVSRDRGEQQGVYEAKGLRDSRSGFTGTRSSSRDRVESPRSETVLRFVIDPTKRQTSVSSEPRGRLHRDSVGSREKYSSRESLDEKLNRTGSNFDGYASDYTTKYTSPLDSPDSNIDRASFYGTFRPKTYQRVQKVWPRENPESPSTPQSTRSGPELYDRGKNVDAMTDNRRRRVERWLETNTDGSLDKDPDNLYSRTTRSLLSDVPEFATIHDRPIKTSFMKYSRSNTDRLADYNEHSAREGHLESSQRSHSQADLEPQPYTANESGRAPVYRTTSEIKMKSNRSQESIDRSGDQQPQNIRHQPNSQAQSPATEKPPRVSRTGSQGYTTYTRSSSSNLSGFGITTNPDGSIEMETPSIGSRTPLLRMRVSFGSNEPPRIVTSSQPGLWNQEDDGSSLLEALKTQGYRNIMTQRLFNDPQGGAPISEQEKTVTGSGNESHEGNVGGKIDGDATAAAPESSGVTSPQRGKDCPCASDSPAETETNACCMMETNKTEQEMSNGSAATDTVSYATITSGNTFEKTSAADQDKLSNGHDHSEITSSQSPAEASINGRPNQINGFHHSDPNGYLKLEDNCDILEDKRRRALLGKSRRDRFTEDTLDGSQTPESLDFSKFTVTNDSIGRSATEYLDFNRRNKSSDSISRTSFDGLDYNSIHSRLSDRSISKSATDCLDSGRINKATKSLGYEEESVSERILRKSFYLRFNEDRPKRKPSRITADTDYLFSDVRGGLWSRFSEPESADELPVVTRRSSRRSTNTAEKRSSANVDDILDNTWLRKSESRNSSLYDDYLSDDDAWTSKPPLPSSRRNTQTNKKYSDSFYEKPGALWNQRRDSTNSRSYQEPSVIDTVPDLTDRRRPSARASAFSFYSPLVTPKSPVFPNRPIVPSTQEPPLVDAETPTQQATPQTQFSVLGGLDTRSNEPVLNRELNVGCWAQSGEYELNGSGSMETGDMNNRGQCVQQC